MNKLLTVKAMNEPHKHYIQQNKTGLRVYTILFHVYEVLTRQN